MAYVTSATRPVINMARLRTALEDLTERMQRRKIYRTTMAELQALPNRELADLGVHRSEIKRIAWDAAFGPNAKI